MSWNQSVFIKERSIADNILVCHKVVRGIEKKNSPRSVMLKVDLLKAYDSLNRRLLLAMLRKMEFPDTFIGWIAACVNSSMFSILVNGSPACYFRGGRGITQGDPISPYLFALCTEGLTTLLNEATRDGRITLLKKCAPLNLSHLIFADDLMVFVRADIDSLTAIMGIMDQFSRLSGLSINKDNHRL